MDVMDPQDNNEKFERSLGSFLLFKMSVSTIFWLLLMSKCTTETSDLQTTPDFQNCKHYVTQHGREYIDFFKISSSDRNGSKLDFNFFVKCKKEAYILFANSAPVKEGDHVYEIVIDAGKYRNGRKDSKSFTKTTRYANRKLSATEFRAFHFQLDQFGKIAVRDEENKEIASSLDPEPLDVNVFSFKSGPKVKAEWYFHCVKKSAKDAATGGNLPENSSEILPKNFSENFPKSVQENYPDSIPDDYPESVPENHPENFPEDPPERLAELNTAPCFYSHRFMLCFLSLLQPLGFYLNSKILT